MTWTVFPTAGRGIFFGVRFVFGDQRFFWNMVILFLPVNAVAVFFTHCFPSLNRCRR